MCTQIVDQGNNGASNISTIFYHIRTNGPHTIQDHPIRHGQPLEEILKMFIELI
jgi:hypothetical protein